MKALVFDMAGVLLHWRPRQMLMRELPHLAPDEASAARLEQAVFQSYGGDWGDFDRGTVGVPELIQRIARRTGLATADVQQVVDAVPRELQPLPDSVAWLQRLAAAGQPLHYLSNMPAPYADALEAQNPFFALFASGVFSARVHHNKPEPAIYQLAAARFGLAPQDIVFLDDTLINVRAAQALGWNALQFSTAAQAEAELVAHGWLDAQSLQSLQSRNSGPGSSPSPAQASSSV